MKTLRKRAGANKKTTSPQSGPKLRSRTTRERKLTSAENAKAWKRWVERGPQGPIEDDGELPN